MASRPPNFQRLLTALRRNGQSQHDAEDLIQEAMLRLHMYVHKGAVVNERAFLLHAVHNLSIDRYRRDRPLMGRTVSVDDAHVEAMSADSNPERLIDTRQRLGRIDAVLEAANPRTRDIYIAHRAGYTYDEIASHMCISTVTIKRHIASALQVIDAHMPD